MCPVTVSDLPICYSSPLASIKCDNSRRRSYSHSPDKPATSAAPQPPSIASGTATPDPEEIDISQHHYNPPSQPRMPSPFAFGGNSTSSFGPGQPPNDAQDPMMALMQQMMSGGMSGGMPGAQGQPVQQADLPPGLANLFSTMGGGAAPEPSPDQSSAWLWRLVHSLFSFGLAIYIVLRTPFKGSKLAREAETKDDWTVDHPENTFAHFFYLFATFEVVLQTSRYFVEKGQLQGSGMLSSVGQMLPEPYAGYIRVVGRYSVIYSTVVSDAMVVVFVLGAASWLHGGAIA
jgi:hypothetical protein